MKIHKPVFLKLVCALSALTGSFGLVFGLAALNNTSLFVDFDHPTNTISYFDETPQETKWNVEGSDKPFETSGSAVSLDNQTNKQDKFNFAALVVDGATHQVLDKSFNQSGYQGLVDWIWTDDWYHNRNHINVSEPATHYDNNKPGSGNGVKPSTDNANDFWITYENLIKNGCKSLVLPGYMHQNGLQNFENKSKDTYLNAGYILLDANEPNDKNIASVIFRSDEAAFMSGIATCQYLNDNFDEYKSGGLRVGTFGGIAIPSVTIYMGGFEYGIKIWNDNINAIAQSKKWENPDEHKVNIINLGTKDSWFSNSFSIGDGNPIAKSLLQRGADAILPVAGPQTTDTVRQIKASGSNCIVVGVDTAQENDPTSNETSKYTDVSGNNQIIKFSATKNIADMTSKVLSLAMAHLSVDEDDQNVGSWGWLTVGDVNNKGITPSEGAFPYLIEFIENATGALPPQPTEDPYDYILTKLANFSDDEIDYFDQNHISNKDFMQLRI